MVPLYPWNSFLHNIVSETIIGILLGDDADVKEQVRYNQVIYRSNLISILTTASKLEKNTVGYMGFISKIGNVLMKTTGHSLESNTDWKLFSEIFLPEKNKTENLILGQGVFQVKSSLELPEPDDEEFFDAIEGPEDYVLPPSPQEGPVNTFPLETEEKKEIFEEGDEEPAVLAEETAVKAEDLQVEEAKDTEKKVIKPQDPPSPSDNSILVN